MTADARASRIRLILLDSDGVRMRTAIRTVVTELGLGVRITPNQDLLLCHVPGDKLEWVDRVLAEHGVRANRGIPQVRQLAMACPALPTCGLAMTEAERVLPHYIEALEKDHKFLTAGDVFTDDLVEMWVKWKRNEEIVPMTLRPHPYEFCMYYDS